MANRTAQSRQDGVFVLPTCDVCGRVLPLGTTRRHSTCEATSVNEATFETIQRMERTRFEHAIQDLGSFRRVVTMQRYDHARSAYVVLDLLVKMSETYGASHALAGDVAHLKYQFLRFAPDHPKFFRQG